jgi:hypothetical protein
MTPVIAFIGEALKQFAIVSISHPVATSSFIALKAFHVNESRDKCCFVFDGKIFVFLFSGH